MAKLDSILSPTARLFSLQLTPVAEIARMPFRPEHFRYEESLDYLRTKNLCADYFFLNKFSPRRQFCYFHNLVLIDLPAFNPITLDAFRISDLAAFQLERLEACRQKEDYYNFLRLVDSRVALEAFFSLMDVIPPADLHSLFWRTYARGEYHLEDFNPTFIKKINQYRGGPPVHGDLGKGYVQIYRGHITSSLPVEKSTSWTRDINIALALAAPYDLEGKVYSAQVNENEVAAYIEDRFQKEIVVYPEALTDIKEMTFFSYDDLQQQLRDNGILSLYHYYDAHLRDQYFHRPRGIHGLSHTRRVLLLTLILAYMEDLKTEERDLLCQAALFHDIGRRDDNFDPEHGRESFIKLTRYGLVSLSGESLEILRFIVENHCVSDAQAREALPNYNLKYPNEVLALYAIFKDADGLDRIRIDDLDVKQLRSVSAHRLLLVARQLLNYSRRSPSGAPFKSL